MKQIKDWQGIEESRLQDLISEMKGLVRIPAIIILTGEVGAGKTRLVQAFNGDSAVLSPTYSLINEHDRIVHADFYRIKSAAEIAHLELPLYMVEKDYLFVEWGMPYFREIMGVVEGSFFTYEVIISGENSFRNYLLLEL